MSVGEKYVGEKPVGEKYMGEQSVGEKYMVDPSVGEKYMGEKSVGEKWLGENRGRWDAGFCFPLLRFTGMLLTLKLAAPRNAYGPDFQMVQMWHLGCRLVYLNRIFTFVFTWNSVSPFSITASIAASFNRTKPIL